MRIVKKHQERKKEFLDTARKLFFTQGYEQTPVEAIIKKVGLSKGSFYYYFKSKEDLLDELTKVLIIHILDEVKQTVQRNDLDAVIKLNKTFAAIGSIKLENIALIKTLQKAFYDDRNIYFRYKVYQNSTDMLAPEFAKIIRQGIEEGTFHTPYPEENARMFFELSFILSEKIPKLMIEMDHFPENAEKIERELGNFQFTIERIVGADSGSIHIFDHDLLEKFLDQLAVQHV
ncbi:MAG: TetR/AcrR family transcriptional regulator [Candidatus Atribacteria bacterium]|nr:TetR/AcrR family transcriptional regulator [Candidatus Atribacteria bacterium]